MGQPKPYFTILYKFVADGPMHQHIAGIVFQQFLMSLKSKEMEISSPGELQDTKNHYSNRGSSDILRPDRQPDDSAAMVPLCATQCPGIKYPGRNGAEWRCAALRTSQSCTKLKFSSPEFEGLHLTAAYHGTTMHYMPLTDLKST